jgi:bifunctional NMN adenylyltransferase/nudix hydrolase
MNKKYDLAVYIGRFQPFHKGHLHAVMEALKVADHVLILVGSSCQPTTPKNPWTFEQRRNFIRASIPAELRDNGYEVGPIAGILPLIDYRYDDTKWAIQVQEVVNNFHVGAGLNGSDAKVVLVGHDKDESSYYLKMFPQWDTFDTGTEEVLDATRIRELLFQGESVFLHSVVHSRVHQQLIEWSNTEDYARLKKEFYFLAEYKRQWSVAPYPPTFVTTDVVVVQSGHVLMIERGHETGVGLIALPGGFLGTNERIEDSALRELFEETNIRIPEKVLRANIKHTHVFDLPGRDLRGRTITHAFLIKLDDTQELPRVKGGDDANRAWWYPIADLNKNRHRIFNDHADIIDFMLGKL